MAIVAEISPLNPATGVRVPLRVAASDDARINGLNDVTWWPGIIASPVLRIDGWDGDFTGSAVTASASIQIDPVALRRLDPASPAYRWAGAPLKVWQGNAGAAWASWKQIFSGLVEDYGTDDSGRYTFAAQVDGEPFEANVLALTYAGTGAAEGNANLKDKPKPMLLGRARNVEPVQIDAVNNVYQVHAYGAISAITNVYERAADLVGNGGTNVGNFAGFASLVAATIPEGSFGTCLALGLFRLGAPPAGLITADVDGDNVSGFVRSTAAVIRRLCSIAGVATARIDQTSLDSLEAVVPYPINLYLTTPTKLIDIVQALARGCNAQAIVSWSGVLRIIRFGNIPAAGSTLDAQGRELPPVLANQELKVSPPYWRIEMRGNRAWRAHSKDEIGLGAELVPMGDYAEGTTYREGNLAQYQGSTWYYKYATASAGNAPPTLPTQSNAYWTLFARAGVDGVSPYTSLLSNENHILPADADGNVLSYAGATTDVVIYSGSTNVSSSFAVTAFFNPQAIALTISDRTVTATGGLDTGEQNATITLRATGSGAYAGVVRDLIWRLTKSRAGADGTSPRLIYLASSHQTVTINASGITVGQITTFIAKRQNAGPAGTVWRMLDADGTLRTSWQFAGDFATTLGGSTDTFYSDSFTISAAAMVGHMKTTGTPGLVFEVAMSDDYSLADRISVVKVFDGAVGATGGSAFKLLDIANCTAPGPASITKRTGGIAWNGKAQTRETGVAARVSGLLIPNTFIGLTTEPVANFSYDTIDYGLHWSGDGNIYVYRNGSNVGTIGARAVGQPPIRGTVDKKPGAVNYYVDGFAGPFTHAPNSTAEIVAGVFALYTQGDTIDGITFAIDGTDGTDGFVVDTETTNFVQPVNSGGANKPAWTGGSGTIRLNKGGARVTAGVSYAVLNNSGVSALALSGDTFSFAGAMGDIGAFTIRASYAGQDYDKVVSVKKVYDGEAAFRGTTALSATNNLDVAADTPVPAGRGCVVSAAASYGITDQAVRDYQPTLYLYWRNVTDGGPWNLLGQTVGNNATARNAGTVQEPDWRYVGGSVSGAFPFTAPTPNKQIGYRAVITRTSGSGNATIGGSLTLEVKS